MPRKSTFWKPIVINILGGLTVASIGVFVLQPLGERTLSQGHAPNPSLASATQNPAPLTPAPTNSTTINIQDGTNSVVVVSGNSDSTNVHIIRDLGTQLATSDYTGYTPTQSSYAAPSYESTGYAAPSYESTGYTAPRHD